MFTFSCVNKCLKTYNGDNSTKKYFIQFSSSHALLVIWQWCLEGNWERHSCLHSPFNIRTSSPTTSLSLSWVASLWWCSLYCKFMWALHMENLVFRRRKNFIYCGFSLMELFASVRLSHVVHDNWVSWLVTLAPQQLYFFYSLLLWCILFCVVNCKIHWYCRQNIFFMGVYHFFKNQL